MLAGLCLDKETVPGAERVSAKACGCCSSCWASDILCVDSWHGAWYQCKVTVSCGSWWGIRPRGASLPDTAPCRWLGSDSRSADRRLFMFVYLLGGSLNFSTRQLNPCRATWLKRSSSPAPQRLPPHTGSARGRWFTEERAESERFTLANSGGFNRFLFSSHRCFRLSLRVSAERKARTALDVTCAHPMMN